MAIPDIVRRRAERSVREFCERRVPPGLRTQIRLECSIRGDSITIIERRPPWRQDFNPEWSSMRIAQLRYHPAVGTWTLWRPDRNGRWNRYVQVDPATDLDNLLREIDEDPTGIFWG